MWITVCLSGLKGAKQIHFIPLFTIINNINTSEKLFAHSMANINIPLQHWHHVEIKHLLRLGKEHRMVCSWRWAIKQVWKQKPVSLWSHIHFLPLWTSAFRASVGLFLHLGKNTCVARCLHYREWPPRRWGRCFPPLRQILRLRQNDRKWW